LVTKINSINDLNQIKAAYEAELGKYKHQILLCAGAGCISCDCGKVRDAVVAELEKQGLADSVKLIETGCIGTCALGPVVLILPERTFYVQITPEKVPALIESHIAKGEIMEKYTFQDKLTGEFIPCIDDIPFFKEQVRIALRNCGAIDYASLEAYIANGGNYAAEKALTGHTKPQNSRTYQDTRLR